MRMRRTDIGMLMRSKGTTLVTVSGPSGLFEAVVAKNFVCGNRGAASGSGAESDMWESGTAEVRAGKR
jgi:hypothetical protein